MDGFESANELMQIFFFDTAFTVALLDFSQLASQTVEHNEIIVAKEQRLAGWHS